YFNRVPIVLDGDTKTVATRLLYKYIHSDTPSKGISEKNKSDNIIALPTFLAPESYLYNIVHKLIYDDDEFMDFWRNIDIYYTRNRMMENIIKQVNLSTDTSNDDLKLNPDLINNMRDFFDDTQALKYYYSVNEEELKEFKNLVTKTFDKCLKIRKRGEY